MRPTWLTAVTAFLPLLVCGFTETQQSILREQYQGAKHVAIVGAGAGGASTAYHLRKFAAAAGMEVQISMYERNDYVGGRTTTVNAYDDPATPIELGGSIFVEANRIMIDAVKKFNLSTSEFIPKFDVPGPALGVWDGQQFVFTQTGNYGWWDTAKLLWKYGLAPVRTLRLMRTVVGKFLNMYDEPTFPFSSITQVAQDLGLLAVTAATGEEYLAEHGITGPFLNDIIQASTRVNYASNLRFIHGLEAMVCMAAEGGRSVQGGNWRIFDNMIKASNATLYLEAPVTAIKPGQESDRISLSILEGSALDHHGGHFDEVVLATPLQFSNISFGDFDPKVDTIPYVQLHTTLFTSPHLLSPAFFNMPSDQAPPKVILTTLPKNENPHGGSDSVGSTGFFSISLLRPVVNPETKVQEYAYKIFSYEAPSPIFLAQLLGFEPPEKGNDSGLDPKDVSWLHRKLWFSYPEEWPRVTFEQIQLADGLWYTSGMDSFISTMETNALAGKNVARLVVDQWLEEKNLKGETIRPAADMFSASSEL